MLLAVMLSTGLVAIDATILAAAVPAVVRDLGGLSQFPWLFSVYLLAQAVSVPIYGKVADLYGRKPVMLLGVALFVVGSLLCGLVVVDGQPHRLPRPAGPRCRRRAAGRHDDHRRHLLGRRARHGAGLHRGGLGDLVAVGPTLGGAFADFASWRWIFLVNLPLGAARVMDAVAPVRGVAHGARPGAARPKIDVLGTVLLLVGTVALLVALLEGGVLWTGSSPVSIGLLVASAVVLVAFVSSSAAPPSRCCRCGCSGTASSAPRWPPRSSSACSCSD